MELHLAHSHWPSYQFHHPSENAQPECKKSGCGSSVRALILSTLTILTRFNRGVRLLRPNEKREKGKRAPEGKVGQAGRQAKVSEIVLFDLEFVCNGSVLTVSWFGSVWVSNFFKQFGLNGLSLALSNRTEPLLIVRWPHLSGRINQKQKNRSWSRSRNRRRRYSRR